MSQIGTSLSGFATGGFFSSLGQKLSSGLDFLTGAAEKAAPLAGLGLDIAAAIKGLNAPQMPSGGIANNPVNPAYTPPGAMSLRPTGSLALPGGAPTMATVSTSPLMMASTGGAVSPWQGLTQQLLPGGSPGPAMCISPVQTRAGWRMPRIVQGFNPTNPNLVETYVRAPRPRYKVTVSGPRKRCRGGR